MDLQFSHFVAPPPLPVINDQSLRASVLHLLPPAPTLTAYDGPRQTIRSPICRSGMDESTSTYFSQSVYASAIISNVKDSLNAPSATRRTGAIFNWRSIHSLKVIFLFDPALEYHRNAVWGWTNQHQLISVSQSMRLLSFQM